MAKEKLKLVLNAGLKALLAGAETSALIKIPATFVSELAALPDEKQKVLGELSQEQFNELFTQSRMATVNAAEAAVGAKQNKTLIEELIGKVDEVITSSDYKKGGQPRLEANVEKYDANDTRVDSYLYKRRMVTCVGRDKEFAQLREFLGDSGDRSKTIQWGIVTGPGGSGKSRLALELCLEVEVKDKWNAGFLSSDQPFDEWSDWKPEKPTLIVVDYALSRAREVGKRIKSLYDDRRDLGYPVRILLLERGVGEQNISESEEEIEPVVEVEEGAKRREIRHRKRVKMTIATERDWAQEFAGSSGTCRDALCKCQHKFDKAWELRLKRIDDDWLWKMICEVIGKRGRTIPENKDEIIEMTQKITEGRPLYIAFAAEALAGGGGNIRQWNKGQLTKYVLSREKKQWGHVDARYANLLALATMTVGIKLGSKMLIDKTVQQLIPAVDNDLNSELYSNMLGEKITEKLSPLEPDILGECFVLEHFKAICGSDGVKKIRAERVVETLLKAAWKYEAEETARFLRRAAEDFQKDEVLSRLLQPVGLNKAARNEWANMAVDVIGTWAGRKQGLREAEVLYGQVKTLAGRHGQRGGELATEQAEAGAKLIDGYLGMNKVKAAESIYHDVHKLVKSKLAHENVLNHYAEAAASMIMNYVNSGKAKTAKNIYEELRKCTAAHKVHEAEDSSWWFSVSWGESQAMAAYAMLWRYAMDGCTQEAEQMYGHLEELVKENAEAVWLMDPPERQAMGAMEVAWGYAKKGDSRKAGKFIREVGRLVRKHHIESFDPDFYYNWGVALGELAMLKDGAEREKLLRSEIEKYEQATEVDPKYKESYCNWGVALGKLAMLKDGAEREKLLRSSIEKYEQATEVDPKDKESYYNWGAALCELAMLKDGAKREELLNEAEGRYRKCEEIKRCYGVYGFAAICAMRGEKEKCWEWLKAGEKAGTLESRKEAMSDKCFEVVRDEEWFGKIRWKEGRT